MGGGGGGGGSCQMGYVGMVRWKVDCKNAAIQTLNTDRDIQSSLLSFHPHLHVPGITPFP